VQQIMLGMGITSRQTAATSMGLDWAQEQQRIEDEAASQDNIGAALLRAFEQGQ